MKKLTLLICLFIILFGVNAQDKDSSSAAIEKLVDSAFRELPSYQFKQLPGDDYYIAKIKFMNGKILRVPFYGANGRSIYVYSLTDKERLDTIDAVTVRHLSFRVNKRTLKYTVVGAGSAGVLGAIVGAAMYDCSNCDGDDFHIEQVWWGAEGALIGGVIGGTAGLFLSIFNDGNFSIKGDPGKFSKQLPRINKYSVLRK